MYLIDMSPQEIAAYLEGEKNYRAKQVREWLLRGARPDEMTNIPKPVREKLNALEWGGAVIEIVYESSIDGTKKYLFRMGDGELVEGVLMRYHHGNTLCLSTQSGCRMGCAFCASTMNGLSRNLRRGEMLSMLLEVEKSEPNGLDKSNANDVRAVTNIVLMGSGEPLDNFYEAVAFLNSVVNELRISPRNISLSTCGLVPEMLRLIGEAPHITLCVSLHAPTDEVRDTLVPINRKYPISDVVSAAKQYADKTGRRVIFEYALIEGVNDKERDAEALAALLRNINCHVNLIPLNAVPGRSLSGVTREHAAVFANWLGNKRISATVRREMGSDIEGACGQLKRRVMEEN